MSVVEKVTEIKEFASLPAIASKILQMLEVEDFNAAEVSKMIKIDPALSIKVLRMANSPLYAIRSEITSIQQAVLLIGFKKLSNLVLSVSIFSKFWLSSRKDAIPLLHKFWSHAASTAVIAQSIVKTVSSEYREHEFLGGLLHQIGTLGLIHYDFEKYKKVIQLVEKEDFTSPDAELEIFGANHIEIGSNIARNWKLPREIHSIIENYNHPTQDGSNAGLVASVGFADILSELNGADFYLGLKEKDPTKCEAFNVLTSLFHNAANDQTLITRINVGEQLKKSTEIIHAMR
jgi:HD-like signal output (HDOD) protein